MNLWSKTKVWRLESTMVDMELLWVAAWIDLIRGYVVVHILNNPNHGLTRANMNVVSQHCPTYVSKLELKPIINRFALFWCLQLIHTKERLKGPLSSWVLCLRSPRHDWERITETCWKMQAVTLLLISSVLEMTHAVSYRCINYCWGIMTLIISRTGNCLLKCCQLYIFLQNFIMCVLSHVIAHFCRTCIIFDQFAYTHSGYLDLPAQSPAVKWMWRFSVQSKQLPCAS